MAIDAKKIISTLILVLLCSYSVFATSIDRKSLYPFSKDSTLFELNNIIFEGNNSFPVSELFPIITSKVSNLNFVHTLLDNYYVEGNKNPITPKTILLSLEKSLKPFEVEYKFISEERIKLDSGSIFNFYNKHGFHLVDVNYSIFGDSVNKLNTLKFDIIENKQFTIDTIVLLGLDSIDSKSKKNINNIIKKLKNKFFNENEIIYSINSINNILINSGYFYIRKVDESIIINKDKLTDSITVQFETGERLKFGDVKFVDIKGTQHKITDNMKLSLLDWKKGDIYSKYKVDKSVRNLLSIGTFNSVSIDTTSIHDGQIDYVVISNYRNQQELNIEPGINQTQNLFYNLFIEGNYTHRNIFGEAQSGVLKASILNRDFGSFISTKREGFVEYLKNIIDEYYIGFNFVDPYLWKINDAYVGLNINPYYSRRNIENFFILENIFLPISFPIKLKTNIDFSSISLNVNFEHQKPIGFDDFVENKNDDEDFIRVFQSLVLYSDLNNYFKNNTEFYNFFSSIQFVGRLSRDKRNNPFMPTDGHLANFELEIAPIGLTKYLRILSNATYIDKISKSEVLAYKLKFGGAYFWEDGNRYISLDKQFFSGGANSVRGWASRKLRYTTNTIQELDATSRRLIENFVGNSFVLEGAIEYRLSFGMPEVNLGALSEHIASMGLTAFFDFGNSYGWLLAEDDYNFGDIFTKLACSVGTGLTYETPVGPIRLDIALPIYGPFNYEYNTIWNVNDALSNLNWHIGLGYSF